MRPSFPIRLVMTAVIVVGVTIVIVAILAATDTVLSIWQRLHALAPWASALYWLLLALIATLTGWFSWRLMHGAARPPSQPGQTYSREDLEQRIQRLEQQGATATSAKAELRELTRRHQEETLYLALFGEMSSGKTSLINALLPDAHQETGVIGGTTTTAHYFHWRPEQGMAIDLVDLPGFSQHDGQSLTRLAADEAARAHVVIYVCDGDLNRGQWQQLNALTNLRKPMILVLNKADRYDETERARIETRLRESVDSKAVWDFVTTRAGGEETITVIDADGRESQRTRTRPPHIEQLAASIMRLVGARPAELREHQQLSGLLLAAGKLADSEQIFREQAADNLVHKYSRRAVVGALAAVAPGTDIVIQGALATALIKALCQLYDVSVREIDIDHFLQQATGKLKRNTSIVLAVAGNALKAFPGVGTLAGGAIHAVAYGMIFDTLGRAVARSLAQQHEWRPEAAAKAFEEQLLGNLETPAKYLVHTALGKFKHGRDDPS